MDKFIHITVPAQLTEIQRDVIHRAKTLHPTWDVKIWRDPVHDDQFLLAHYWPRVNSGAQFADLFRLDALYRWGGVYIDSDVKLFRSFDELAELHEFFIASEDGESLTNAVIGAKKESSVIRDLIDRLLDREPDWAIPPNRTTGPAFFTRNLRWRRDITVLPRETFYTHNFNSKKPKENHRHSYGEHLWIGSWTANQIESKPKTPNFSNIINTLLKRQLRWGVGRAFHAWDRICSLDPAFLARSKIPKSYAASGELVVRTVHGFNIVVDGQDVSLTPDLVFHGYYELPEENFVKRILRGGDWMIDVGANVGTFSLLAAQSVGPFGRVFAYEPNLRVHELLAKSLVMNWVHDRVVQRQVAVGDGRGSVKLSVVSQRLGDAQVESDHADGSTFAESARTIGENTVSVVTVPCVCLDEEFPVDLPIKLLKIDVEGYEGSVLKGARRLLKRRCIDFILLEMLQEVAGSHWHETLEEVEKVTGFGYTVHRLKEDGELTGEMNLGAALESSQRNIVLVAQGQYYPA